MKDAPISPSAPQTPVQLSGPRDSITQFVEEVCYDLEASRARLAEVESIDAYYETVRTAGATFCGPISDTPWGMREFGVVTVDGHRIMFGEAIPTGAEFARGT